jgi:hypothetical protein
MNGSSPASASRLARAARTFMVGPDEVIRGACRFAGRQQPVSHQGRVLLERLVPRLDKVPLAILATPNDLADAAEDALLGKAVQIPALPEPIVEVAAFIDVLVSRQSPCDLRDAAVSLGLDRAAALRATALTRTGKPLHGLDRHVTVLEAHDCRDWSAEQARVLRVALGLYLADIGDAVLRASERQPGPLSWRSMPAGGLVAVRPVPGAPQPLEAHITHEPSTLSAASARQLFGTRRVRPEQVPRWQVGWRDGDGTFESYSSSREASLPAAKFAAAAVIGWLAERAGQARMRFTGALLVPRPADGRNTDSRVIDLEEILVAVLNEYRGDPRHPQPGWRMWPHRTADADLGSIIAALFDQIGAPWPGLRDDACSAPVESDEFSRFLAANALALTPLARCYLAGMGDAGPGDRALADRHTAGMRAVLHGQALGSAQLDLELPAPDAGGYGCLVDIRRLEAYFDQERPETPPHER